MFVVLLIQVQVPPERQTNASANARQVSAYTSLHTDNSGGASWQGMAWHFPRPPVQGGPLSGDDGPLQEEPHQRTHHHNQRIKLLTSRGLILYTLLDSKKNKPI